MATVEQDLAVEHQIGEPAARDQGGLPPGDHPSEDDSGGGGGGGGEDEKQRYLLPDNTDLRYYTMEGKPRKKSFGGGKRSKGGRRSNEITFEEISKFFHLKAEDAAEKLGIGQTVLKKICRRHGISRWPFRRVAAVSRLFANFQGNLKPGTFEEAAAAEVGLPETGEAVLARAVENPSGSLHQQQLQQQHMQQQQQQQQHQQQQQQQLQQQMQHPHHQSAHPHHHQFLQQQAQAMAQAPKHQMRISGGMQPSASLQAQMGVGQQIHGHNMLHHDGPPHAGVDDSRHRFPTQHVEVGGMYHHASASFRDASVPPLKMEPDAAPPQHEQGPYGHSMRAYMHPSTSKDATSNAPLHRLHMNTSLEPQGRHPDEQLGMAPMGPTSMHMQVASMQHQGGMPSQGSQQLRGGQLFEHQQYASASLRSASNDPSSPYLDLNMLSMDFHTTLHSNGHSSMLRADSHLFSTQSTEWTEPPPNMSRRDVLHTSGLQPNELASFGNPPPMPPLGDPPHVDDPHVHPLSHNYFDPTSGAPPSGTGLSLSSLHPSHGGQKVPGPQHPGVAHNGTHHNGNHPGAHPHSGQVVQQPIQAITKARLGLTEIPNFAPHPARLGEPSGSQQLHGGVVGVGVAQQHMGHVGRYVELMGSKEPQGISASVAAIQDSMHKQLSQKLMPFRGMPEPGAGSGHGRLGE